MISNSQATRLKQFVRVLMAAYPQRRTSWMRSKWSKLDFEVESAFRRIGRRLWSGPIPEQMESDVSVSASLGLRTKVVITHTAQAILTFPHSMYPLPLAWLISPVLMTVEHSFQCQYATSNHCNRAKHTQWPCLIVCSCIRICSSRL